MATETTRNAGNTRLRIIYLDQTPSTNNYATALLAVREAEEGCLVWTQRQTRGRGYGQNVWESEAGKNLTFSLILEPRFLEASRQFQLSQVISLGLADFLAGKTGQEVCCDPDVPEVRHSLNPGESRSNHVGGEARHTPASGEGQDAPEGRELRPQFANRVTIKWPNDIYAGNRKIAGILIENSVMGDHLRWTVAGVGLNVNQESFPSHLPQAVSLRMLTGREYDLKECLTELANAILVWYDRLALGDVGAIGDRYLALMLGREEYRTYRQGDRLFRAVVEGVDEFGQLRLRDERGHTTVWPFKSIEWVGEAQPPA